MTGITVNEVVEDVGFFIPVQHIDLNAPMSVFLRDGFCFPAVIAEPVLTVHSSDAWQPPTMEGAEWVRKELIKMVMHACRMLEDADNHEYVMKLGYERQALSIRYIGKVYRVALAGEGINDGQ